MTSSLQLKVVSSGRGLCRGFHRTHGALGPHGDPPNGCEQVHALTTPPQTRES